MLRFSENSDKILSGVWTKEEKKEMKRVLSCVMALVLTVSGLTVFGDRVNAKAAGTNVSREAAMVIEDNGFKEGSFTKTEGATGLWYKFTNNSDECKIAEVTMVQTSGDVWPGYSFSYANGKAVDNAGGYFTGSGDTKYIGVEAHETVYLHIFKKGWSCGFSVALTMLADDANSLETAKKVYKSGKNIYGKIQNGTDVDVFKIKAKKSGKMVIKITNNDLGNDLSKLKYTIYNKSRKAKKNGEVRLAKTEKITMKVKKNQVIYVSLNGYFFAAKNEQGSYVISTKIKK